MSPIPERLVIASRGSRLALEQAAIISALVVAAHPDLPVEIMTVATTGDRDRRPFGAIGGKSLFVAEVERAVAEGHADAAVHSAKDVTAELGPGCAIVCVPERASVHDVVVGGRGGSGDERLASLETGARVGTSSMRRRSLLAEAHPHLDAVDFRGNLDTRVAKVLSGEVDVAILAAAGLDRLGGSDPSAVGALDPGWWVPAPGQGALVVEAKDDRHDVISLFEPLIDRHAWGELRAERAFAARLEGGCSVPLGCLARISEDQMIVTGYLGDPEGGAGLRDRISGSIEDADDLGRELAEAILAAGGDELLANIDPDRAPEVPAP
jgi:hydroxymethylbilane synthase